jgi:hypothetical protein
MLDTWNGRGVYLRFSYALMLMRVILIYKKDEIWKFYVYMFMKIVLFDM